MTNNSLLTRIPENSNLLQTTKFTFSFPTLPFLRFFCQSVSIPGVSTSAVQVPSPFSEMYRHGDKLVYDDFATTVIIDEDLRVWEESYNWIRSLTFPKDFPQYVRNLGNGRSDPYHDGILTTNTNANIPNVRFKFTYCHPTSISAIQFTAADNADTTMTIDIRWSYDLMEIDRLDF